MSDNKIILKSAPPPSIASVTPSEVPDPLLPYGPPPARLAELETDKTELDSIIKEQIRSLTRCAKDIHYKSQDKAAACWHEAGRLLDKRAGRKTDAWRCYNMALKEDPNYKQSIGALRRLSREANDQNLENQLLNISFEVAQDPVEKSAIWCSAGILEHKDGEVKEALNALSGAEEAWPETVVGRILKVSIASLEDDVSELHRALENLAKDRFKPALTGQINLVAALLEERMGRLDDALKRLEDESGSVEGLSVGGQWAKLRLSLRLRHYEKATKACDDLQKILTNQDERVVIERLKRAVANLTLKNDEGVLPLVSGVNSEVLGGALDVSRLLDSFSSEAPSSLDVDEQHVQPPSQLAAFSYLGIDHEKDDSITEDYEEGYVNGAMIEEATWSGDFERLASYFSSLREKSSDDKDRFAVSIAEAYVGIEHLKRPGEVLSMLLAETDRLNRAPLPALIRAYDTSEDNLAELAVSEAEDGDFDEFKAWRFAWAAHHTEPSDRNEAGRLYLRALELMPSMMFAISGLGRTVSDRSVLAEAYLSASVAAADPDERFQCLLRAAVQMIADGNGAGASEMFGEALDINPNDITLRKTVSRLARSHPEAALMDFVEPIEDAEVADDQLNFEDLLSLGHLALTVHLKEAVGWFDKALSLSPGDPIAEAGRRSALFRSGNLGLLKEEIRKSIETTETADQEAAYLMQLINAGRRLKDSPENTAESLEAIERILPGVRTSLCWLMTHYISKRGFEDLPRIYEALSRTVDDRSAAIALGKLAWRGESSDLDLLRFILKKDPSALLEAARLEALTEDLDEKRDLLEKLTVSCNLPIHKSRLAGVLGELGEVEKAGALHMSALEEEGDSILDLIQLAQCQRKLDEYENLTDTLVKISELFLVADHKVEALLEAIDVAINNIGDPRLTAKLCMDVLRADPGNKDAYALGVETLKKSDEVGRSEEDKAELREMGIDLMRLYLEGVSDDKEKLKLNLSLAGELLKNRKRLDREDAKKYLEGALAIDPNNVENQYMTARVYREDEEWEKAIDHLIAAARFVKDAKLGSDIFLDLGAVYMDHTENKDLAEKSLLKVIGWNSSHRPALERISKLYCELGRYERSAKALSHLIGLTEDQAVKVSRMVELARIQYENLGESKQAENLLKEASRLRPFDFGPIAGLADLYSKEGDKLALNVHLDTSVSNMAAVLVDKPDNWEVYDNLRQILSTKGDSVLESFAIKFMEVTGKGPVERHSWLGDNEWQAGTRVVESDYDGYFCPKTVPTGLAETMKAIEGTVATLKGLTAKDMGLERSNRLDRKSPVTVELSKMAKSFGMQVPNAYSSPTGKVKILPGSPPEIVFPKAVATLDDPAAIRFCVGTCLQMIRLGFSLATSLSDDQLVLTLSAVVNMLGDGLVPKGVSKKDVEEEANELQRALPEQTVNQIGPFLNSCKEALGLSDLAVNIRNVGHRFGFVCAGSLKGGLGGLRKLEDNPAGALSELEGAGLLIAFIFSRDHVELRRTLGL